MIEPADFHEALLRNGLTFFTGVPDSLLKDLCAYMTDNVPPEQHVINANEGSAVALAAGYHLATGRIPVVYLQNSGIGNAINPLLSLADAEVYAIPMLLVIGWRGEPGVHDEPQHMAQGRVMPELLRAIGLEYDVIGPETQEYAEVIERAVQIASEAGRPRALLVQKGTFKPYAPAAGDQAVGYTRREAVERVLAALRPEDLLVTTTGMTSREVFASRELHGQGHDRDFLTVGSMGHASQIAMGVARHQPGRRVFCLDGDGAVIMHMGSLAIIGTQGPRNLTHLVINNGAHDSVGGQPTAAKRIDLATVALACGYRTAETVGSIEETDAAIRRLRQQDGPAFLEIQVVSQPDADVGRPTTTPRASKAAFMQVLGHGRP